MRNSILVSDKTSHELNLTSLLIPGRITNYGDNNILKVSKKFGKGYVQQINLQPGIDVFYFDLIPNKTTTIPVDILTNKILQFFYCKEGVCHYSFEGREETALLDKFQTVAAQSSLNYIGQLTFQENTHSILNLICIRKEAYFDSFIEIKNYFDQKFDKLIRGIESEQNYLHLGRKNLKIAEQLHFTNFNKKYNITSSFLMLKGRQYQILAEHIEQFYSDIRNEKNTSSLLKRELETIINVSKHIRSSIEDSHTINQLSSKFGLSPAKLQEGFRFMYEQTVTEFIRNTRLEKAEQLIKTTDLSISEVVYQIGFTSRSYFCKIFKQKYNCRPRDYRKNN